MRKITEQVCRAFEARRAMAKDNTRTDGTTLFLFNRPIAEYRDGDLWICDGDFQSMTTKERLNGLQGVSVTQKAFQWYLNGEKWDGHWRPVNKIEDNEPAF
jgi:hypothetical protein